MDKRIVKPPLEVGSLRVLACTLQTSGLFANMEVCLVATGLVLTAA